MASSFDDQSEDDLSLSELRDLQFGTSQYYSAEAILSRGFSELSRITIPQSSLHLFLDTLSSKKSVAKFQKARLFQYFVFSDEVGRLDSINAVLRDDIPSLFSERLYAVMVYGMELAAENALQAQPDPTEPADILQTLKVAGRKVDQAETADSGGSLSEIENELSTLFPGLTLGQLGNLCRAAAEYTRAEALRERMENMAVVPAPMIAEYLLLVHGAGYAMPSAGLGRLNQYLLAPSSVDTEAAHLAHHYLLSGIVGELEMALALHPMLFATLLARLDTQIQEAKAELSQTKHVWQVSKGHDRLRISRKIDAQLHVMYLRMSKAAPKSSRVNWQEISELANLDAVTQTESPEQYARKLWSDRGALAWTPLFLSPECVDPGGFVELARISDLEYLAHASKIELLKDH